MIEIREVKTKKERKQFVEFPLNLYKDNEYFVPPLYGDEMNIFKPDYVYYEQAEAVYFNAYRDGVIVGRISGILQKAANEKWGQKQVRFTRFDSIDDQEVANALLGAVEDWAKSKGMEEIVGPLGFSDLEREGLLIEGFDQMNTFEEQYNYPYYQKLIENCGYGKDVDWVEHQLRAPAGGFDPKYKRISDMMLQKYNLHFGQARNTRQFINKYAEDIFHIWDETYDKIYGTVPFTDRLKKSMIAQFKLLIDKRFLRVLFDENGKIVAFGVVFPSISDAVRPSGGRLTLPCIFRVLKAIKHPKVVDLAVIGVTDEYKNKGLSAAMLVELGDMLKDNVEHAETNLNLEHNIPIQNAWKYFDAVQNKRRRCFLKRL
ncbi:MAG: N-acetyltransferase [Clostridiales bacterium]|nr:N-acetyltransferase [Clostridiales bacterium]